MGTTAHLRGTGTTNEECRQPTIQARASVRRVCALQRLPIRRSHRGRRRGGRANQGGRRKDEHNDRRFASTITDQRKR